MRCGALFFQRATIAISFFIMSLNLMAVAPQTPCMTVIIADWGMQETLHNELEPTIPPAYTLALHLLGKKTVATGQRNLLIQIPTIQECQPAKTYYESLPEPVRKRIQGVWIEANDGASAYPKSPAGEVLVFSQPPLHPNPPPLNNNVVMGHFWVTTSLPLAERQKIYNMAFEYAKKAGNCVLSITVANKEVWDHFQEWAKSLQNTVQWGTLAEHINLNKKNANEPAKP